MASNNRTGTALGATALIAAAIALIRSQRVSAAGTVTLDDATKQLLIGIAQASGESLETVKSILAQMLNPGGVTIKGYPSNFPAGITGRITINQLNHAYQLPGFSIPDDVRLVLKAWPTNAGLIYIGFTAIGVTNQLEGAYPLILNEPIAYRVQRASQLYGAGTVVGDSFTYTAEQGG